MLQRCVFVKLYIFTKTFAPPCISQLCISIATPHYPEGIFYVSKYYVYFLYCYMVIISGIGEFRF